MVRSSMFVIVAWVLGGCSEYDLVPDLGVGLPTSTEGSHDDTPVVSTGDDTPPAEEGVPPEGDVPGDDPTTDPGGDDSDDGSPGADVPADNDTEGDVPAGDDTEGDVPAGDGDVPAGDDPGAGVPGGDVPAGDVPADGDVPAGDTGAVDDPAGDVPEGDTGAVDAGDPNGCTPGYWKQPQHLDAWPGGLTPDLLFVDVFAVDAFPGLTLLDVLGLGNGDLDALGRHSVAALLNALSGDVEYPLTDIEVIDAFVAGYLSGDYSEKDELVAYNEDHCPLS